MNRRTLLKKTVPLSLLLAGCSSKSDNSDGENPTNTSTALSSTVGSTKTTKWNSTTTVDNTHTQAQTTSRSTTDSTTKQTTSQTTEQTTSRTTKQTTSDTTDQSTTQEKTTTNTPSPPDHPSASGIFDEPRRGPQPFSSDATLIVFEDPSCPNCVNFEQKTYPKLKRKYSDTGKLSIVFRTIPVIQPWGTQATYALESAYARHESAYWKLKSYYFDNQDQFSTNNIVSKTKDFVNQTTRVKGQDVVHDIHSKSQKRHVKEDLAVAKKAGIRGTPTSYAFRSDNYVTEIVGRQSYSVFENILGL